MTADQILIKIILFGKFAYSKVVRHKASNLKRNNFANLTSFFISSDHGLSVNLLKFKKNVSTNSRYFRDNNFFLLYFNCYFWKVTISQLADVFGPHITERSKRTMRGLT